MDMDNCKYKKIYFLKKLSFAFVILVFAFYFGSELVFSDSLDISQEIVDRGLGIRHTSDGDWTAGQSFVPNFDVLTRAELSIRKMGSPDFDLTLELRKGSVTGNLLDSQTYLVDSIISSFSWIEFNFTDVTVDPSVEYYIVASLPPTGLENSFGYELGYAFGDVYLDGNIWYTNNTGASWFELADNDLAFRIYGYDNEVIIYPELDISVSSSIEEKESFQATVTSEENLVEDVLVVFSGSNYYTSASGTVTITAPSVTKDTIFTISASKTGYISAQETISVTNVVVSNDLQLKIGVVSSVEEKKSFEVYVLSEGNPVEGVLVVFSGSNYYTSESGTVTIFAPIVITDTIYAISASKAGYISIEETITVLNYEQVVSDGYIYGTVLNNLGEPIENAKICIIVSENNGLSYKCVFTDINGGYLISISEGAYNIEVSKNGYLKYSRLGVNVNPMLGTNVDFELEIDQSTVKPSKSLLDYTIDEEIKKGSIIGVIDVSDQEEQVLTYNNSIDLEVLSNDINTEQGINIKISGEGAPGTKIVVYLGELENSENLIVLYDNVKITQTDDAESFLQKGYDKPEYLLTSTVEKGVTKYILIINNAHYSEHEIVISLEQIVETLGGTTAILYYVSFLIIVAVLFVGVGTVRRRF